MEFSEVIPSLLGSDLYMYTTQENPEREDSRLELAVHSKGKKFLLPLSDDKEASYLASSMHHFLDEGSLVLSWGVKDFFSSLMAKTGILPEINSNIYDLSIVCSYFGYPKERPSTFKGALAILRKASLENGWNDFKKFNDAVYKPLFSKVVPGMENCCIVDNRRRSCVYPFYVIEGQANGRLKAFKNGKNSYNPHSLGSEEKRNMRPAGYDEFFVYLDFRNMEVCVLRWLSGDERLGSIIDSGLDPYREIWRMISGSEPTDSQRMICKGVFLPVVFGLGRASLAKKMSISEKVASSIIDKLVKSFPKAFDWVEDQSDFDGDTAMDAFGRKRAFGPGDSYKARNFCIQAPASMVCLRKLVRLHSDLSGLAEVCFHVHDGYCLVCDKSVLDEVCELGIRSLESDDDLFPDLRLRTSCKFGLNLDNLESKRKVQIS